MAQPKCPICKSPCPRPPENATFPFCSKQCKLADLGNWLDGRYVLPEGPADVYDDEGDPDRGPPTLH